jgi:hypothetical protein
MLLPLRRDIRQMLHHALQLDSATWTLLRVHAALLRSTIARRSTSRTFRPHNRRMARSAPRTETMVVQNL